MDRKHSVIFLSFFLLLSSFGCKDPTSRETPADHASIQQETNGVPFPYAGEWLREEYVQRVLQSGSPRKAQEDIEACYIRIPAITGQSTVMIYNFHESGGEWIATSEDSTFTFREKNPDGTATDIRIESLTPDRIKIGEETFLRIKPVMDKDVPLILEEILFAGQYRTAKGEIVEFKNNGEVSGLDEFRFYAPVIDYFDAGLQIDQVGLGPSRAEMTSFGFTWNGKILELYTIKCLTFDQQEDRCVEVDFGKKIYALTRVSE